MISKDGPLTVAESAWLAGLWDGEGSVGVVRSRATGTLVYIPQIQLHMTHEPTVAAVVDMLRRLGCTATAYRTNEKKSHHKTSYSFAVRRTAWIQVTAATLLPYAVTKRDHWAAMLALCEARIDRAGLASTGGWLRRGGPPGWHEPYTTEEERLVTRLCALNERPIPPRIEVAA